MQMLQMCKMFFEGGLDACGTLGMAVALVALWGMHPPEFDGAT